MTPNTATRPRSGAAEWSCSECGSELANCQGVLACTDCAWVERD